MNTDLAAQKAIDRLARAGFEGLTEVEKILVTVWNFEAGVANRGFAGFFSSASGDTAFYAPIALKAIGAADMTGIAVAANAVFGPEGPPRERKNRRALVRSFGNEIRKTFTALETRFYESREDPDQLLDSYLAAKKL